MTKGHSRKHRKRYGLPQTMRQVATQGGTTKLGLTADVYEQLMSTGLVHINALARRNCTILIEIELLNGKYYSQSFDLSDTMSWVVEHPQIPWCQAIQFMTVLLQFTILLFSRGRYR